MSGQLKLLAESPDDLMIVSATLQDAIIKVGSIHFHKAAQRLELLASRYCHEDKYPCRMKSGLGIYNITHVRFKGINRTDPDAFLVLLAIEFTAGDPPGGVIKLLFAGGGEMVLTCDILELRLVDMDEKRQTNSVPLHPDTGLPETKTGA